MERDEPSLLAKPLLVAVGWADRLPGLAKALLSAAGSLLQAAGLKAASLIMGKQQGQRREQQHRQHP